MNIKYLLLGIIFGIILGSLVIWLVEISQKNIITFTEHHIKHCKYECLAARNAEINCDNWCNR